MSEIDLISKEKKEAGLYLMELIRAALTGQKAKEKPEHIEWKQVFQMAKYQNVESVSAYGVETLNDLPDESIWKIWKDKKNKTLFKLLHFDMERERILTEMEAGGLSYLPLKGVLLATYYPIPGMRSMADNDILYGYVEKNEENGYRILGNTAAEQEINVKKAQDAMVEIMEALEYETANLVGNHDTFYKKPFYNFEMHRELLSSISDHKGYYKNPWQRAVSDEKSKYRFHMSDEDEYIYMMVHMEKHFMYSGCGVRHLNDVYVFWKKKGAGLDKEYLKQEFKKLQMEKFEQEIRTLAHAIFVENRKLTEMEENLLYYLLGCGVYGRLDIGVSNKIEKMKRSNEKSSLMPRLRYIWSRIFIDEEKVKEYFPFFYGKPYLKPVLPIYRLLKGLVIHPKTILTEWKNIWKKLKK